MTVPLTLSEVPDSTPYKQYVATSGQTVFPYPFPITQDSDLVVNANGVDLATDSGYTLSGVGNDTGGNVTFATGRAAGDIVTLYRDIPIERLTQIGQNSGFSSTTFNAEFNNIYLIMQQLESSIAQCLQIPNTNNPAPSTKLASNTYANKYLAFDANGNPTPAVLTSSGSLTAALLSSLLDVYTGGAVLASYVETSAETAAGATPQNYSYPPLDVRRYGADPTGVADSTAAFNALFSVLLQMGGGACVVPSGTYKITSTISLNVAPASGPSATTSGITLYAHGAVFNYTGTGYAFDFSATQTSAGFGFPLLQIYGANLLGTSSASGGFRTRSMNCVRFEQVFVQNFTAGPAWTVLNDVNWSEDCFWRGCGAVSCKNIISFQKTGGTNSFARTYVDGMFGASISEHWFLIGGNTAVYDSRFTHICGNFTSLGLFQIGDGTGDADMSGTVLDGLDYEINSAISSNWSGSLVSGATSATLASAWTYPSGTYTVIFSDQSTRQATYTKGSTAVTWTGGLSGNVTATAIVQQSVAQIVNYPQGVSANRRPSITNVGTYATFLNNALQTNFPVWAQGNGASLTGPETNLAQGFGSEGPITSTYGQSTLYEPNFSVAAVTNAATYDAVDIETISLTGCSASVSGRVWLYRVGNTVRMRVYDPLTGTSNTTAMTSSALPAKYRPSVPVFVLCPLENNSVAAVGMATIGTDGVITFATGTSLASNGFTASGTKGLPSGYSFSWDLG